MEDVISQAAGFLPLILATAKALVVLIVGWFIAGRVGRMVRTRINRTPEIDPTIGNFAASSIKWVILLMVLVAILGIFGIEATSLVAVFGADPGHWSRVAGNAQ